MLLAPPLPPPDFLGADGFGGCRLLRKGGFGMGEYTTLACSELGGSINQPARSCWLASRMAKARPCCCSNKIPPALFFWQRRGWWLSLLLTLVVRTCPRLGPAWLGPSLIRTRPFHPHRREGTAMEVRGEDFSRGREGKVGWRWSFIC